QADPLACRIRAKTPLWSWKADASGVSGRYTLAPVPAASGTSNESSAPITLGDGRFPHDDISQVGASDGKLFTVWQGRQVGVHAASSLRLTADVRNHQFAEPVRLVAVGQRIPLLRAPDTEVAPAVYALEGPRTWRFTDQAWARVD